MPRPAHPFDPAIVLAHDRYLKSLARSLVADAQSAEDLAQQAWVKACERGPSGPSIHGWLRTTLRHLASRLRRTDARRARREALAARPQSLPSHEQMREQENARRAVADAVLALEEPYCTTVVLRFFEGLPPRAIARRMDVPVETVRTRIKRALEQLRAKLDREHGDRSRWCLALAPLARPATPLAAAGAVLSGALLVTIKTKVLAAALVGVALSLLIWRLVPERGAAVPGDASPVAAAAPVHANLGAATQASRARVEPATRAANEAARTGSLLVHVRWSDGTPAADVGLRVGPADAEAKSWLDEREGRTDATGDARFADLVPRKVFAMLDRGGHAMTTIESGKQAEVSVRAGFETDKVKSLCERQVEGIVVDKDGTAVGGAQILVSISPSSLPRPMVVTRSAADGTFAVRDVHTYSLIEARAAGYTPSPRHCDICHLAFRDDATPRVRIKLVLGARGGSVTGIVRDPHGQPLLGALVQVGLDPGTPVAEVVRLEDGTTAALPNPNRTSTDAQGRFACEGIATGRQDVVVRARGLGLWTGNVEVFAGRESVIAIDLLPPVTLRGNARDTVGKAVEGAEVRIGRRGLFASDATFTRADGGYELRELAAGALDVVASSNAYGETKARLVATPGETLTWDPVMDPGSQLFGRVLDEQGAAFSCQVIARAHADKPLRGVSYTDAAGRFAIPRWRDVPTTIDVLSVKKAGLLPCARLEDARPGYEIVITVREADLPKAYLIGRLVGPDAKPHTGAQIHAYRGRLPYAVNLAGRVTADLETGAFKVGPLTAGDWKLEFHADGCASLFTSTRALERLETRDLGTVALQAPGTLEIHARRADAAPVSNDAWIIFDERGGNAGWVSLAEGKGTMHTLTPGKYVAQVRGKGVAHSRHPFSILAGERTRLEVELTPASSTVLEILTPTSDTSLELRISLNGANGQRIIDRDSFRLHRGAPFSETLGLLPGTYRGEARTEAGSFGAFELKVEAGPAPKPVRVELR